MLNAQERIKDRRTDVRLFINRRQKSKMPASIDVRTYVCIVGLLRLRWHVIEKRFVVVL